jgi:P27 family predicted phage terminase small subunit
MNAPDHLDEQARAKWAELAPTLDVTQQGVADALACYSQAWSRWTAAEAQVNELGAVVKSPAGFAVANPYVTIAAAASRQLRQWGDVLKITPKARGKAKGEESESAVTAILRQMQAESPGSR